MSAGTTTARCHRIFLASAGTGKTYRLSGRFLDLLLAQAEPRSILATTFTRKAAGEILDRVLERLVGAVDDEVERAALAADRDFGGEFGSDEALHLLTNLVRRLDRFEVRTLDSFFVHLGRLFALDLDLAPQWSVATGPEADDVTADALARLLEDVQGADDEVQFAELLREIKGDQGAGRGVHLALLNIVGAGREVFLDSPREAWERVVPGEGLSDDEIERGIKTIEGLDLPRNKGNGKDNATWSKNRDSLLEALGARDWKRFLGIGLVKKVRSGDAQFGKHDITDDWARVIETLFAEARHRLLGALVLRNTHAVALLSRYESLLQTVKRERGLYEFADIPRALAPPSPGGPSPITARELDLAYRLDGSLDHLLLDEFQDTAPIQWRVLSETAENICADGSGEQSFFCVGDVKQSIYGWRSAEPRLLATLGDHLHVDAEPLHLNYRSSEVILDTVNQVFQNLPDLSVFHEDGKDIPLAAAQIFQGSFEPHEPSADRPGFAELRQARLHREGEKAWTPVMELAAERVIALAADQPRATIGILLRSNTRIPLLIARLQAAGLQVSGEGGNPLTDSAAVLHFLSLLHLADHPADSMAAFHLTSSPLPAALGFEDALLERNTLAASIRSRLSTGGLGRLCTDLDAPVQNHEAYSEWDLRRYRQLGDLACAWSERAGLRADGFVDWVRTHKVEVPAAASIKVMTVHASKGLEFDAVILPELDGSLAKNSWTFLSERPDPRGILTSATLNPGKAIVELDETLESLFSEQSSREVQEALCVLYVGMTRARHRLEMIVRDRKGKDGGTSSAGILRTALGSDGDNGLLWRHPDSSDAWFPEPASTPVTQATVPTADLYLAPTTSLRRMPTRSPSSEEGGATQSGADLLNASSSLGTRFGSLVHRFLQELEWPGEDELDVQTLLPLGAEFEPNETARREALSYLQMALSTPDIQGALSHPPQPADDTRFEVWREREFCVVLSDDQGPVRWSGSFDRVLLHCDPNGKPVAATIQDYKTDQVDEQTLDGRVLYYTPQLLAYRRALSEMSDLPPEAIRMQLLFLGSGIVQEVKAAT